MVGYLICLDSQAFGLVLRGKMSGLVGVRVSGIWAVTEDRSMDVITREREELKKARRTFGKAVLRDGVRGEVMADKALDCILQWEEEVLSQILEGK